MGYRVEQLAAACDVSVDTIRYYQSKGLLAPPKREGRVAIYERDHLLRVKKIRALQQKGLTLAVIKRVVEGKLKRADADLATAVAEAQIESAEDEFLSLDEVAARSGVPSALLRAIERAGLALGRKIDGEERFTTADVTLVRQGLRLLDAGLPINDLLALAGEYNNAARAVAERAVEMFDRHIRDPIRAQAADEAEAADKLVAAFGELLPAVTALVSHHFRRVLLAVAEEHIERVGGVAEIAATRAESRRLREA